MAKKKKTKEPEGPTVAELEKKAMHLERELFDLRNERAMQRKLEKPHLLKKKRHERARMLTLLTQVKKREHASG